MLSIAQCSQTTGRTLHLTISDPKGMAHPRPPPLQWNHCCARVAQGLFVLLRPLLSCAQLRLDKQLSQKFTDRHTHPSQASAALAASACCRQESRSSFHVVCLEALTGLMASSDKPPCPAKPDHPLPSASTHHAPPVTYHMWQCVEDLASMSKKAVQDSSCCSARPAQPLIP